jgi:ribosomal protein S18 acetylase RimI-like enzyme
MDKPTVTIAAARFPRDLADVRGLFREYIEGLGVDLTFQDVTAELGDLPGKYGEPAGIILMALDGEERPIGCIALRPLPEDGACEMKRLYVRREARGKDLGRRMAEALIAHAKQSGYKRMYLDTLASMATAQKLYASLGFRPTAPYYNNPLRGTQYLVLDLG